MGALDKGSKPANSAITRPLCVDVDGTLLNTDLLHEAVICLLKVKPWGVFQMVAWTLKGPAFFKSQVFARVDLNLDVLPVNQELVEFLKLEKENGRELVLASASPKEVIQELSKRFGIFSEALGSSALHNLKGKNKAAHLESLYGAQGFDYIGNSKVDRTVWQSASIAHVVGSERLLNGLSANVTKGEVFDSPKTNIFTLFKALRVHQWVKNLLVFVPILMAHTIFSGAVLSQALLAFFALCFSASAIYILNDLFDLESDRQHPKKSKRVIASGSLSIAESLVLIPILLLLGALFSFSLGASFWLVLGLYLLVTTSYSFWLKQVVLLDIFILAGLYTLRIIAGGAATATLVSPWLLAFSMFTFLSLACAKRAAELHNLALAERTSTPGRGYLVGDFDQIARFGSTSGYLAVLVLALYINSPAVSGFYTTPWLLWFLCPILLYWFSRVWLLVARGELNEDPVVFSLTDFQSYLLGATSLIILWLAT